MDRDFDYQNRGVIVGQRIVLVAIEAIQTLLRVPCYLLAGSNEAIRGSRALLAGLSLAASYQQGHKGQKVMTKLTTNQQEPTSFHHLLSTLTPVSCFELFYTDDSSG